MSDVEKPDVIEAQQFLVRDKKGTIRASFGVLNSWSETILSLNDETGTPRVYMEIVDGFPTFRFMRPDGNPLFSFGKTENGSPILAVSRNDATPALIVIAKEGSDVMVGICRRDGEPIWLDLDSLDRHGES